MVKYTDSQPQNLEVQLHPPSLNYMLLIYIPALPLKTASDMKIDLR